MTIRSRAPRLVAFTLAVACVALAPQRIAFAGGSPNGIAGSEPTYYDHIQHTINLMLLSPGTIIVAHNTQTNIIWQSDGGLPGGQPFISIINALPGDGFNPLWEECQITFNPGHTPRQLFSDDEVAAAAAAGEITVTDTHELYRCSVVGKPTSTTNSQSGVSNLFSSSSTPAASPTAPVAQGWSWSRIKALYR